MDYAGKVVVITGAAGGLGLALSEQFLAAGACVALLDMNASAVHSAAERLLLTAPGRALAIPCDISDAAACQQAISAIIAHWGGIDVLVNNAGIAHRSLLCDTDIAVLRKVMAVNFFGAVQCTHAALHSLRARRGQIVVISSIAGFSPLFGRTGYSASKHALHGFFDSLRSEVEDDGVDVTIVCPAFIATGIERAALGGDGGRATLPRNAVGGEMSPHDMAARILAAVRRRQRLYLPTSLARLAWWASRLVPAWFARQMKRRAAPSRSSITDQP
ncbi:MAG TPA: SDR family oxidoreductase [Noviherbaspirillum sp.]|uniref:SDR family oxidoreductase n=1 Tax=Noviherbaspirillum sp. TaxID=1926288 RepID=UPI002B4A764B|nr:SDR family oxidoreductase [Noviherbaspirillum sp.]HJV84637.1 SDR family oxidoreductase [Noviherbaspirillum sp.]